MTGQVEVCVYRRAILFGREHATLFVQGDGAAEGVLPFPVAEPLCIPTGTIRLLWWWAVRWLSEGIQAVGELGQAVYDLVCGVYCYVCAGLQLRSVGYVVEVRVVLVAAGSPEEDYAEENDAGEGGYDL